MTAARSSSAGCSSGSRRKRLILDFYPGTDAEHPTEVVVRFAQENGGTRVVVQHRPKPESADLWAAGAPRFERAWTLVLPALERAADDDQSVTIMLRLPSPTPTAARAANE